MADQTEQQPDKDLELREAEGDTVRATWPFALDRIRQDTAHFPTEDQEQMVALFRWCIDPRHPMRLPDAAKRLSCSSNLIYQLLKGIYRDPDKSKRGPSAAFLKNVREFLKIELERYQAGQTEFVETPTAKKIFTNCDLARESQSPVILFGPSHIGKTWALKKYQQKENHGKTLMAELEAASGLGGMIRILAEACSISDKSNTANLIKRIKNSLTPNTVLIIDEVHLLKHTYRLNSFFGCIEVLRRIYDHCECGMVLSWTNLDNLKAASEGELVQLWRRGVHKVGLPMMPTKGDLTAILQHNKLNWPDKDFQVVLGSGSKEIVETPYEILRQVAQRDGLKAITERLRYGRKLASRGDGRMNWNHFVDAHLRIAKQAIQEPYWT